MDPPVKPVPVKTGACPRGSGDGNL